MIAANPYSQAPALAQALALPVGNSRSMVLEHTITRQAISSPLFTTKFIAACACINWCIGQFLQYLAFNQAPNATIFPSHDLYARYSDWPACAPTHAKKASLASAPFSTPK